MKLKYSLLNISLCLFSLLSFCQNFEGIKRINGADLYIKAIGKGSPIIIIHGGPGLNYTYFLPQLTDLSKKHRLIFFDQRASGKSSADFDSSQISLNMMVDDIDAIRRNFGNKKISVLGHSWGGLLAMKYAIKYPQYLKTLILVSTVSPKAKEFETETNAVIKSRLTPGDSILRSEILKSESFKQGKGSAYQAILKLSFKPSFYEKRFLDSLNLKIDDNYSTKRKTLLMLSKDLNNYDFYESISTIKKPVLIIHGDFDAIPLALPQKIQTSIPTSRLVVIQNAGHFPFIEKQKEFSHIVLDFLKHYNK